LTFDKKQFKIPNVFFKKNLRTMAFIAWRTGLMAWAFCGGRFFDVGTASSMPGEVITGCEEIFGRF